MRRLFFIILAVFLVSFSASASTQTWLRYENKATEYRVLYFENGLWLLDTYRKPLKELQEYQGRKVYTSKESAEKALKREGFTKQIPQKSLKLKKLTQSEVSGEVLWKATNEWSWEWEEKYAQWMRTEVTEDFFLRYSVATDCADVAYSARWIFSRIYKLPAASTLAGSGTLFTHETMKKSWADLPTSENWYEDQRFLAALDYMLLNTYTHTLFEDSYPIEVNLKSMIPGAYYLTLNELSGHTQVVSELQGADAPLVVVASTVPRDVRALWRAGFWEYVQPQDGGGGFLRMRWLEKIDGQWQVRSRDKMPYFSKEQYQPDFMVGAVTYAEAVLMRLTPEFEFRARLRDGIRFLKEELIKRQTVVEQGFAACQAKGCEEGSPDWESWSTPSRDARINTLIGSIESLLERYGQAVPQLIAEWNTALSRPILSIEGEDYNLAALLFIWKQKAYSSNPRLSIAERWGIRGDAYADLLLKRLSEMLARREEVTKAQGSICRENPVNCAPGTQAWSDASTSALDRQIQGIMAEQDKYCALFSKEQCASLAKKLQDTPIEMHGLKMNSAEWARAIRWMNSDPRAELNSRWGDPGPKYSRREFSDPATRVSRNGLFLVSDSSGRSRVLDLQKEETLKLPKGFYPVSIDAESGMILGEVILDSEWLWTFYDPKTQALKGTSFFEHETSAFYWTASWIGENSLWTQFEDAIYMVSPARPTTPYRFDPLPELQGVSETSSAFLAEIAVGSGWYRNYRPIALLKSNGKRVDLADWCRHFEFLGDGHWLLTEEDEGVFLSRFNSGMELQEKKKIGKAAYAKPFSSSFLVESNQGTAEYYRLAGGTWEKLKLLEDETALLPENMGGLGEWVVTLTNGRKQRLRKFDKKKAVLETGEAIRSLGGGWVLVVNSTLGGQNQVVYDLVRSSQVPVLTLSGAEFQAADASGLYWVFTGDSEQKLHWIQRKD